MERYNRWYWVTSSASRYQDTGSFWSRFVITLLDGTQRDSGEVLVSYSKVLGRFYGVHKPHRVEYRRLTASLTAFSPCSLVSKLQSS